MPIFGDILDPLGHKTPGSPFYGATLARQIGGRGAGVQTKLVPFQAENIATNQQTIPVPYLAGERLVALRWVTPALDMQTKQADATTKKG